ncbi:MAG: ParA family protein [Micromonosporaceae bacterium]|nr:ParA family protein [Micromonosporaceae bacterium]
MIALVSAKGSPGVTASALAFTLTWPGRCLLAECDPAGGDVLAGYLRGGLDAQRGLAQLAVAELRGRLAEEFERQLVDLDPPHRRRLLLPGVRDPAQSATVGPVWGAIAEHLRRLEPTAGTVIADCGRLGAGAPVGWPVLQAADRVLLVLRGSLPSVSHAVPAIQLLHRELAERADRLGLLVVEAGPYPAGEVAERLQVPLAASLPADPRTARALSFGGPVHRRRPLARAAAAAHATLARQPEVAGAV